MTKKLTKSFGRRRITAANLKLLKRAYDLGDEEFCIDGAEWREVMKEAEMPLTMASVLVWMDGPPRARV